MNTDQLECATREDRCLKEFVRGVFPSDRLPYHVNSFPSAYVCNTDPSGLPGKHWVTVWFRNPIEAEFYDSLGRMPDHYGEDLDRFIKRNTTSCTYNNVPVQSKATSTCGFHVLFYLLLKCRNVDMKYIVSMLQKCKPSSDFYVYEYVTKYFDCI